MGAIGTEVLRYLVERGHTLVGVVDTDPEKVGRTVAEITGLPVGTRVSHSVEELAEGTADVAVFATTSRLTGIASDVMRAASLGMDVVATAEEMAFPESSDREAAGRIDALAKEKDVTVVGVGVNPGFVMDWVPALVLSASKNPTKVHVVRSVDVSRRRRQLQAKAGVGLTRAKFEKGVEEGSLGHVGLVESASLIARSLGTTLEDTKQGVFPVLGSDEYVLGVRQFAEGTAGRCLIRLDLEMSVTSADFDVVEVKGDPDIKLRFEKGVFGDSATVALVVHAVERVAAARPGVVTVLDLPLARP